MQSPTWISSPNFTPGRPLDPNKPSGAQSPVRFIVIHHSWCTLDQCDSEFKNDHGGIRGDPQFKLRRSAHFSVDEQTIHQFVKVTDSAWHAGIWSGNCAGIGIEVVEYEGHDATPGSIATTIELATALCKQFNIKPGIDTILPHNHFIRTACPGTVSVLNIINRVQQALSNPVEAPVTIQVAVAETPTQPDSAPFEVKVTSAIGANIRVGFPFTVYNAKPVPIYGTMAKGSTFKVHSQVMGENEGTNNVWYLSEVSYQDNKSNKYLPLHYVWSGGCTRTETTTA